MGIARVLANPMALCMMLHSQLEKKIANWENMFFETIILVVFNTKTKPILVTNES